MTHQQADAPFFRIGPQRPALPVVLSVPHAGRDYSEATLRASRLPLDKLEMLEDRLVDRLVWRAADAGATAIIARTPRAEIDLNRHEREIDPATIAPPPPSHGLMQSARTRGGLGLIPARIAGVGSIWLRRLGQDELWKRLEAVHAPYHEALDQTLEEVRSIFGAAILLDCHSMPPRSAASGEAELVFGDRYGTSTSPVFMDAAIRAAEAAGYRVSRNVPYAGGYITERHGRPERNVHALQIEIDRSLYLGDDLREPGPGFDRTAQLLRDVSLALADAASEHHAIAAE
ncbi:MAG TPA: N-formylglutamate amidohydrolase [Allosphingosinicella sp.]|nr:N-formylglutamate amidohydrolase [Allosphingosinicella sp.]